MCGRYTLLADIEALSLRFGFLLPDDPQALSPRYNIAPSQEAPVVVQEEGRPALARMRWGLIPSWSKDAAIGYKTINARAETLAEKPAFRDAFAARRCLVPADGFYEWKREGKKKLPMRAALSRGGLFAMAGLWEAWRDPKGALVRSYTIVTVPANAALATLHERMPAILRPGEEAAWLAPRAGREALAALLRPLPAEQTTLAPVSTRVNSAANEGPELLRPEPSPPETPTFL